MGWLPDDRVLDLGAGPAHVSTLFAPYAGDVVAMEPDEAMLEEGRRRAASAGVENLTFVHGGSADLERLRSSVVVLPLALLNFILWALRGSFACGTGLL
jgi:ubiquinone/menaquinone biosynthesis C-methylase UbiE